MLKDLTNGALCFANQRASPEERELVTTDRLEFLFKHEITDFPVKTPGQIEIR
ncbi:MAG: hypothetical protein ACLUAR_16930 [Pilosibacter sp.]